MESIISVKSLYENFEQNIDKSVEYSLTDDDIYRINDIIIAGFYDRWGINPGAKRFMVVNQPYYDEITYSSLAQYLFSGMPEKIMQLEKTVEKLLNDQGYATYANEKGLYIRII